MEQQSSPLNKKYWKSSVAAAPMSFRREFPAMQGGLILSAASCLLQLLLVLPSVSSLGSSAAPKWQTLSGDAPFVIAQGGFSGIFPDSSSEAYNLALLTSVPDVILWCDVQLTKDAAGICFPDLTLDNGSNIVGAFSKNQKVYDVNGVRTQGWFALDFTLNDFANVLLTQGVQSRTNKFDGDLFQIQTVEDVFSQLKPQGFWLNIQHDAFYSQHNLSMRSYVLSVSRRVIVNYISSPEVSFLRSIASRFRRSTTKLVFRFLGQDEIEPSTNQTYGSLLKNISFVKTFSSGIIVPKSYIWPVDDSLYLLPHTSVVSDAHKEGLEIFASDFANDFQFSFNYSYDPVSEYISFIDNGDFSVDGVISDFPITPSEAIDCFAHLGRNASKQVDLLVISKNGASGDYPGCTDLAYAKAVDDGADVIDCPVQMTKDGIPICLGSINLMDSTTAAQSSFNNLTKAVPEITPGNGIFTFDLTWSDIQSPSLRPAIANPQAAYKLFRNPKYKNAGNFVSLADFLDLAKKSTSLSGVLIGIENAAYLAEKQGLGVIDAVVSALGKAGFDKQSTQKVMMQSSNSSVLKAFKGNNNYELVYNVYETIRDALDGTVEDIKSFADSVVVTKKSIFPVNMAFITGKTDVVTKIQSLKLPVYVETFSNEFTSQAWDFFSDPTVEINSFYSGAGVNGVITDFPKTSAGYARNRCSNRGKNVPQYMYPVQPGGLMPLINSAYMPPTQAPMPVLYPNDVVEPPLPAVMKKPASSSDSASAPSSPSSHPKLAAGFFVSTLMMMIFTVLLFL